MNIYQAYIPTNLDWLDKIPIHWKVSALKRVLAEPLKYGATEPGDDTTPDAPRYIRITDFDNAGSLRNDTFVSLPEEIAREYYLTEGDVLFARSGATVGKTFLFRNYPGRACFAGYLIKASTARHKLTPEFLYYFTKSPAYEAWKDFIFTQATIQNIGADKYAYLPVCLPPIEEQERIATYLDASCAALDAAVAAKRRQLEVLEKLRKATIQRAVTEGLNESPGLVKTESQLIPQIPVGWRIVRLKGITEIRYGLGQPPPTQLGGVPMIRATNIDAGRIIDKEMLHIDPDELPLDRNPYLKENEIIVVRSGAYTGDSAIIPVKYVGAVAGYDMVVTVTQADPKFIAYALLSDYMLEGQISLLTLRAAQAHLNAEELGSLMVVLPPSKTEQQAITAFLDTKLAEISSIESIIEAQIETLVAYRKSLIHECVTGQRRLTDAEVAAIQAHATCVAAWRTGENAHG
jgi:type I restriction enzyme S subunit